MQGADTEGKDSDEGTERTELGDLAARFRGGNRIRCDRMGMADSKRPGLAKGLWNTELKVLHAR